MAGWKKAFFTQSNLGLRNSVPRRSQKSVDDVRTRRGWLSDGGIARSFRSSWSAALPPTESSPDLYNPCEQFRYRNNNPHALWSNVERLNEPLTTFLILQIGCYNSSLDVVSCLPAVLLPSVDISPTTWTRDPVSHWQKLRWRSLNLQRIQPVHNEADELVPNWSSDKLRELGCFWVQAQRIWALHSRIRKSCLRRGVSHWWCLRLDIPISEKITPAVS